MVFVDRSHDDGGGGDAVRQTHDAEFSAYAAARWPSLVRAALLLGCSPADAEDLAQRALIKTWSAWRRVREAAEPDSYVYRILLNTRATDRRRRWHGEHPTEELPEPGGPGTSSVAVGPDPATRLATREAVVAALRTLPRGQQEVLVLRFVADLTERATADALGVAVGTVKSRTARALAALEGSLDPDTLTSTTGETP